MKRVAELDGAELALWVARATGMKFVMRGEWPAEEFDFDPERHATEHILGGAMKQYVYFLPHKDWAQGGPIIERERMSFAASGTGPKDEHGNEPIVAISAFGCKAMEGPTHLIAAMRAFVASKFGETVDEVGK